MAHFLGIEVVQSEKGIFISQSIYAKEILKRFNHCNWTGIACNIAGSITRFNLSNYGIKGALQKFNFSRFPNVEFLNLGSNDLYGSIHLQPGDLPKLYYLDLSWNNLTGKERAISLTIYTSS
ncbi:hypothetical protein ACOSQ2_021424 [Xanthoceras sorbifolium]